jgi:hypothetical protein
MTHLNNQVISKSEKAAIAETVHETLSEFRDELKRNETSGYTGYTDILEGSCFYYAALGAVICTKFYRQKFNDSVSYYTLQAGAFQIRAYEDKYFYYTGDMTKPNDYHCWIVGPINDKRKPEIIDFTARHYKVQVGKQNLGWDRKDLDDVNFIWTDNYSPDKDSPKLVLYNEDILLETKRNTTEFVINKWKSRDHSDLLKRMIDTSDEILAKKLNI